MTIAVDFGRKATNQTNRTENNARNPLTKIFWTRPNRNNISPPGPFILTSQFAHGNSAPSKNMPRSGPVAAPLKLKAACKYTKASKLCEFRFSAEFLLSPNVATNFN